MDDYVAIFSQRAQEYNAACKRYPRARQHERQLIVDWLDIGAGQTICDWPAGGGYLAEGLAPLVDDTNMLICVEPVWEFIREIPSEFNRVIAAFDCLTLKPGSVDRVGSLAGLHHEENREIFFRQAFDVLKPSEILAVADVMAGTATAEFLNGPVDKFSSTGHKGMFFEEGELAGHLKKAGFVNIEEKHHHFTWDFPDWPALIFFSRNLFGLSKASDDQIQNILKEFFCITSDSSGVHLP